MENIKYLLYPKKIAVIGASRDKRKVGRIIFDNLLWSGKDVIPVNPKADKIGRKKAYPSILEVPKEIDLAVIAVKNFIVPKVLKEAGEKGVKATIIISAGFSEVGNRDLEEEIIRISKEYNIATLGPNCLGVINTKEKLNATFMKAPERWEGYAIVSQSGALGAGLIDMLKEEGMGYFISVGNQAVLKIGDFVEFLSEDKNIDSIGIYMESTKDGRRFYEVLKKSDKNIFVLKSGRTKAGELAARSHTGAMVTDDKVYSFVIKQARKVRVNNLLEFTYSLLLSSKGEIRGKKVMILTNSGGPGVMLADFLEENGFEIVKLDKNLIKEINKILPEEWSHGNPIDVLGDADSKRFREVLEILKKRKDIFDILVICLTPLVMTDVENIAREVVNFRRETGKFIVTNFIGGKKMKKGIEILRKGGILNIEDPEILSRVLRYVYLSNAYKVNRT